MTDSYNQKVLPMKSRFEHFPRFLSPLRWSSPWSYAAEQPQATSGHLRIYVGTYTSAPGQGINVGQLDLATGDLRLDGVAAETKNPSFLAVHPNRRFLYAVGEISDFAGKRTGAVSAFRIVPATGRLELLNQESSGGAGPCHVTVDPTGRNVLVANYGGGSVSVLPIREDGSLAAATAFVQHEGSSADPRRQQGPHAHSINLDAANRFAFAADLGLDKILIYRFDPAAGTLAANDPAWATVAPGSGPRHFAFHPSGKFAYVINEMKSTLTAFRYDAARGALDELQTVSTLPAGPVEGNTHGGSPSPSERQVRLRIEPRARQHRRVRRGRRQRPIEAGGKRIDARQDAAQFRHRSDRPIPVGLQSGLRTRSSAFASTSRPVS